MYSAVLRLCAHSMNIISLHIRKMLSEKREVEFGKIRQMEYYDAPKDGSYRAARFNLTLTTSCSRPRLMIRASPESYLSNKQ